MSASSLGQFWATFNSQIHLVSGIVAADAAATRNRNAEIDACTLVPAFVVFLILLADQVQVAANGGGDLIATRLGTLQGGIVATAQGELVGRSDNGFSMRQAVAVGAASCHLGSDINGQAGAITTEIKPETNTAAAGFVTALTLAGIGGGLQQQVIGSGQANVGALHLRTDNGQISAALGAIPRRLQADDAGADADFYALRLRT